MNNFQKLLTVAVLASSPGTSGATATGLNLVFPGIVEPVVNSLTSVAARVGSVGGELVSVVIGSPVGASEMSDFNSCVKSPNGGWVYGSADYPPGTGPGTAVINGHRVENAGGGKFWYVCDTSDIPGSNTEERQTVVAEPESSVPLAPTVAVVAPVVTAAPPTAPPTTKKEVEVGFKPFDGADVKDGESEPAKVYRVIDGETVGEDNQEVAPVIPEEPAKPTMPVQTVTPATMPINKQTMFEGPAVEEAGPNGVAFSGTRVEPNDGLDASEGEPTAQSKEAPKSPEEELVTQLRERMTYAYKTGSAQPLVDFIKMSSAFFPVTEGVPEVGGPGNPIRRMPSSHELGGITIYNFDKDAPIKERLATPQTIALALLLADTYQNIIMAKPGYPELAGSCIRFGDFSALDGHQTHDGNEFDATGQKDCSSRVEPADGAVFVYLAGNDSGLDGNRNLPPTNSIYSRELTEELLRALAPIVIEDGTLPLIERVLNNDPQLVELGVSSFAVNHASHAHFGTSPAVVGGPLKQYASGGGTPPDAEDAPSAEAMAAAGTNVGGNSTYRPDSRPTAPGKTAVSTGMRIGDSQTELSKSSSRVVSNSSGIPVVGNVGVVTAEVMISPEDVLATLGSRVGGGADELGGDGASAAWRAVAPNHEISQGSVVIPGGTPHEPTDVELAGIRDVKTFYEVFAPSIAEALAEKGITDAEVVGFVSAQLFGESSDGRGGLNPLVIEGKNIGGQKKGGIENDDNPTMKGYERQTGKTQDFVVWDRFNGEGGFFDEWILQRQRVSPGMFKAKSMSDYANSLVSAGYAESDEYYQFLMDIYDSLERTGYV